MKCSDLVQRIERREPDARPYDVARLAVLMTSHVANLDRLDDDAFDEAWDAMGLRLQAVTDQHEAIAEEMKILSNKTPGSIVAEDLWTLMRVIKVQMQVLRMYTTPPEWASPVER